MHKKGKGLQVPDDAAGEARGGTRQHCRPIAVECYILAGPVHETEVKMSA